MVIDRVNFVLLVKHTLDNEHMRSPCVFLLCIPNSCVLVNVHSSVLFAQKYLRIISFEFFYYFYCRWCRRRIGRGRHPTNDNEARALSLNRVASSKSTVRIMIQSKFYLVLPAYPIIFLVLWTHKFPSSSPPFCFCFFWRWKNTKKISSFNVIFCTVKQY